MTTAKFANKRRHRPGDLSSLRRSLWASILTCEELHDSPDPHIRLKAIHGMASLSRAYLATLEVAEIEQRLVALEGRLQTARENEWQHVEL